jgi:hypothetical protein
MGYKGQIALYLYYIGVAFMLKAIAPPLAAMTAQESALVGAFRWGLHVQLRSALCSSVFFSRTRGVEPRVLSVTQSVGVHAAGPCGALEGVHSDGLQGF